MLAVVAQMRDCPFLFVESTTAKGKWSFSSRAFKSPKMVRKL